MHRATGAGNGHPPGPDFSGPVPPSRGEQSARSRSYDRFRGSAASRGYGAGWARLARQVRREEPLCRDPFGIHRSAGSGAASECVDHIVPRRECLARGLEPEARDNLQALCKRCHDRKTATEDGGFGHRKKAT